MRKEEGKGEGTYPRRYIYVSEYSNSVCPHVVMVIVRLHPPPLRKICLVNRTETKRALRNWVHQKPCGKSYRPVVRKVRYKRSMSPIPLFLPYVKRLAVFKFSCL